MHPSLQAIRPFLCMVFLGSALALTGCGGGGGSMTARVPISVSLVVSKVTVSQDGKPVIVGILIDSPSETALVAVNSLPTGCGVKYASSDTNPSGTLEFTANLTTPAGTYMPTVTVNSAGQMASTQFTLVVTATASSGA
jgi:hypothetical protein